MALFCGQEQGSGHGFGCGGSVRGEWTAIAAVVDAIGDRGLTGWIDAGSCVRVTAISGSARGHRPRCASSPPESSRPAASPLFLPLLTLSLLSLAPQAAAAEVQTNCPGPRTGDKRADPDRWPYEADNIYVDQVWLSAEPSSVQPGKWLAGLRVGAAAAVDDVEMIAAVAMAGTTAGDRTASGNGPGIGRRVAFSGLGRASRHLDTAGAAGGRFRGDRGQQELPCERGGWCRCALQPVGVGQVGGRGERSRQLEQQPLSHSCRIVRGRPSEIPPVPASAELIWYASSGDNSTG